MGGPGFFVKICLCLGLWFMFAGCYEPIEGCLDPVAENYRPEADDPCCCDYPDRGVQVEYRWDTLSFRLNRDYVNEHGDSFRLTGLHYFGRDFRWHRPGGFWQVEDRRALPGSNDSIVDDWVTLSVGTNELPAGTLRSFGTIDSFSMSLGIGTAPPESFALQYPAGHPLDTASSPLYDRSKGTWSDLRLTVIHGNATKDTLLLRLNFDTEVHLRLGEVFELPMAEDHFLKLRVDVKNWLSEIDWKLPTSELSAQIFGKMSASHHLSVP